MIIFFWPYTYSERKRYDIHLIKSSILIYPCRTKVPEATYTLGEDQVQQITLTKYPGILRDTSQKPKFTEKIKFGRSNAYSLKFIKKYRFKCKNFTSENLCYTEIMEKLVLEN